MKINRLIFSFLAVNIFTHPLYPQDEPEKKYSVNGYVSNMQSVIFEDYKENWITDNLFHNRINCSVYPAEEITLTIQFRNRFMYGETIKYSAAYADAIDMDNGFLDLSMNIFNENSFFLNTAIDRIYLQISKSKFVATIGRQRINWGISSVWNPNDIFNVQNYFDFDYIEKPGSDAIRLQYYTGPASTVEFAAKINNEEKLTMAAYFKFNKAGYDLQFLGGFMEENDLVAGFGWSGDIRKIGFKGEMSYFHPMENSKDTSGIFLLSMGGDYMFSNSIFIQFEALYRDIPGEQSISDFLGWYQGNLNVKNISFTDMSLFGSISYPFSPLLNGTISAMYFPELKGFFAGPQIDYSATDNIQLSLISQFFNGELPDPSKIFKERRNLFLGFLRFKWNF